MKDRDGYSKPDPRPTTVGPKCNARRMSEETTVEKLTLISEIDWLYFEPAIFIQPGETFWVEGRTLHVRALDGSVRRIAARAPRPDDRR
jgi:hypothetical protein